jgi:hypothetical protein
VIVRIPNIMDLVRAGKVPADLLEVASREALDQPLFQQGANGESAGGFDVDAAVAMIKSAGEFQQFLVSQMLIEPELTVDELVDVPPEDLDYLIQIADRRTDVDAKGVRLGVMPLSEAERFHFHHKGSLDGDASTCAGCQAWRQEFSSVRLGEL